MPGKNIILLLEYKHRLDDLMSEISADSDLKEIKSKTKKLKSDLKSTRNLDPSIAEIYSHMPNLVSHPINNDWHSSFYDAHFSAKYWISHS